MRRSNLRRSLNAPGSNLEERRVEVLPEILRPYRCAACPKAAAWLHVTSWVIEQAAKEHHLSPACLTAGRGPMPHATQRQPPRTTIAGASTCIRRLIALLFLANTRETLRVAESSPNQGLLASRGTVLLYRSNYVPHMLRGRLIPA